MTAPSLMQTLLAVPPEFRRRSSESDRISRPLPRHRSDVFFSPFLASTGRLGLPGLDPLVQKLAIHQRYLTTRLALNCRELSLEHFVKMN